MCIRDRESGVWKNFYTAFVATGFTTQTSNTTVTVPDGANAIHVQAAVALLGVAVLVVVIRFLAVMLPILVPAIVDETVKAPVTVAPADVVSNFLTLS